MELKGRLSQLDEWIEKWSKHKHKILTAEQIERLRDLAKKNAEGNSVSPAVRKTKQYIHEKLRDAMSDIAVMTELGFIGGPMSRASLWDPHTYNEKAKSRLVYDPDKFWREDFPAKDVAVFIMALVEMFGDEYAIPLVGAIEDGLSMRDKFECEIQVSVVRRDQRIGRIMSKENKESMMESRKRQLQNMKFDRNQQLNKRFMMDQYVSAMKRATSPRDRQEER